MRIQKCILSLIIAFLTAMLAFVPASPAAKTAQQPPLVYGDVDLNGKIDALDALICLQYHVREIPLSQDALVRADVDENLSVDPVDAMLILQYYVGYLTLFPVQGGQISPPDSSTTSSVPVSSVPDEPPVVSDLPSSDVTTSSSLPPDPSSPSSVPQEDWELEDLGYEAVAPEDYWNYNQLNNTQKRIYRILDQYAQIMPEGSFYVASVDETSTTDIFTCYLAMRNDHPEYFWMSRSCFVYTIDEKYFVAFSDSYGDQQVSYNYTKEQSRLMAEQLMDAVERAFRACLRPNMTDYEKELALHGWLTDHCFYLEEAVTDIEGHLSAYESYGALVQGAAVCEGYARAFQLLCYYAGINCTLVTGHDQSDGGHMWNMAEIDGQWYMVDPTWDDSIAGLHYYFNQTTEEFEKTHQFDVNYSELSAQELEKLQGHGFNFNLPECTATEANYYVQNGLVANDYNQLQTILYEKIPQVIQSGGRSIEVYCPYRIFNDYQEVAELVRPIMIHINGQISDPADYIYRYQYSTTLGSSYFVLSW